MKKYKVTDKHELLKKDITLEPNVDESYFSSAWAHVFDGSEIKDWNDSGWIEEIQELEFTKDDMISILNKYDNDYVTNSGSCDFKELLKEWIYFKEKTN